MELQANLVSFQKGQGITSITIPANLEIALYTLDRCRGKPALKLSGPLNYDLQSPSLDPAHQSLDNKVKSFYINKKLENSAYLYLEWVPLETTTQSKNQKQRAGIQILDEEVFAPFMEGKVQVTAENVLTR